MYLSPFGKTNGPCKKMKRKFSKISFVGLVLLFIYIGFHPEKIAPDFFSLIIPLGLLHKLSRFILVLPVIAFIFCAVNMAKYVKSGQAADKSANFLETCPIKSILFFLSTIALLLILGDIAKTGARNEVKGYLGKMSGEIAVSVNGELVANPNEVVDELKKVTPMMAHHSRITKTIRVEILGTTDRLVLELGRDSDFPQEYWVLYPKYGWTLYDDIGRIVTSFFDDY